MNKIIIISILNIIILFAGTYYSYSENNNLKRRPKEILLKKNNTSTVAMRFEYYDSGSLKKTYTYGSKNDLKYYIDFICDNNDLIITESLYRNNALSQVTKNIYNKSNLLIKAYIYDSKNTLIKYRVYDYKNNKIIQKYTYTPDDKIISVTKYIYQDNLLKIAHVIENDIEKQRFNFLYDSSNQLTGYLIKNSNNKTIQLNIIYEEGIINENSLFSFFR